ncbi:MULTISPECIES: styrene monooxygenase subunit StyA [Bradyrhizobium]|uniref:styrene monooxygenase subunit StyA n=1 Tax=Bradyrhizobium elkanii TaxID=29448 RepID=UPI002714B554|nr:styrene monooxygenase/indole monooxygenase family protein [Bradyrhizobium elkanii]WLA48591.1 monooxygenase [Bradyrhizobium elkanii]WLB81202.1 monooxygenase [Bradyrhizobium elkanii]
MNKSIGIVGAGIGGLHLALYLQQHGIQATVLTDRTPEQYASARLMNTVAHHSVTIARENELGVNHWDDAATIYHHHDHFFNFPGNGLLFRGAFKKPSRAVDYRMYLPTLMKDFEHRGGSIEYASIQDDDIPALVSRFDLLVVSTGKGALGRMFAHRPELSPYSQPQRLLCVGLYDGIDHGSPGGDDPRGVTLSVSPGHGEMIVIPTLSFSGMKTALLMENIPGGDMADLVSLNYDADPAAFRQTILDKLEKHHPHTYNRIDTHRFGLAQPLDLLQGAVVPTVRQSSVAFDGEKFAVALGDVHSVVDPLMGQGANIASYAAFELGKAIVETVAFDARFVEEVDRARENRVFAAARWTNLMLRPPSEAMGRLILTMAQDRELCDEFTDNFNYPERQWDRVATDKRIHAWIDRRAPLAA